MNRPSEKQRLLYSAGIALLFFLLGQCIEQLFLYANGAEFTELCSWDCGWYRSIAAGGYDTEPHGHTRGDAANWGFFPLFPLLARLLHLGTGWSLDSSLILAGKFFSLTAIFGFILLIMEWRPGANPWVSAAVVAFQPYSIYGNTGYTESLFLTLTCFSLFFLRKERYVLSGVLSACLSGTRIVGGSIGFSFLVWIIRRWRRMHARMEGVLGLCLVPAGLAAYMLFLYFHMGDALAFSHVQIVAWNHEPVNPLTPMKTVFTGTPLAILAGTSILIAFLAMIRFIRRREYELLVFTALATLLPLSGGLISMPRYIWWQAPILMSVSTAVGWRRWTLWLYLAGSLAFSYAAYAAWFRGSPWIV